MPKLAIGPTSYAVIVRDTRPSSAPFRAPRACPPCLGKSRRFALPCALLARLAAHLERTGKMPLTDLCNRPSIRALVSRPIPALAAYAAKSASEMSPEREPHAIRSAASDHLAAIQPRVELRLTTLLQLRTNRLHPSWYENEEEKSSTRRQSFSGVAFSAAPRADDPASDAPCRAPRKPIAEPPRSARIASTARASTRAAFPTRGAFRRQVLSLAFAEKARHRTLSFAAVGRLPAFFRSPLCSRRVELDPGGGDGVFARGRLDRAPLANFCNRNEMRAQLLDQSNPAHRAQVAFGAATIADGRGPFRSSASRDFTGQGRPGVNHARASSHRDRSRSKLFPNPIGSDTSCRKPVSAGGWRCLRRRCALY
jgi:hypothetical protein